MLKSLGVLGILAALGGGTYVTVKSVASNPEGSCPLSTAAVADEACTMSPCCAETQATVAKAEEKATDDCCPADAAKPENQTTASAAPAPAAEQQQQ
jgi:hypothetical protein